MIFASYSHPSVKVHEYRTWYSLKDSFIFYCPYFFAMVDFRGILEVSEVYSNSLCMKTTWTVDEDISDCRIVIEIFMRLLEP